MFQNLTSKLGRTLKDIRGQGIINEKNIDQTLREVRRSLLEADVALPVVKEFIDNTKQKALGTRVSDSLTPGQELIKIFQEELNFALGSELENKDLNLNAKPPVVIMLAGLQGAGKTTSLGKLAKYINQQYKKSILAVSCDIYRPAAIEQLQTICADLVKQGVDINFQPSSKEQAPLEIAKQALNKAKIYDVLLIDTAGRQQIDQKMMDEIKSLSQVMQPQETLFVADSMLGQNALVAAKTFNEYLDITGIILSKVDGDARGGAAFSVKHVLQKPIKFLGVGEKLDALERFTPDKISGQILGMGDVVGLIEQIQSKIDLKKSQELSKKIAKQGKFNLNDFLLQLEQMQNMGGIDSLITKMPGMGAMAEQVNTDKAEGEFNKMKAIINSMTLQERNFPNIIKASRKKRVAAGSGTQVQDVNRMLSQYDNIAKMMSKIKGGGIKNILRNFGGGFGGADPSSTMSNIPNLGNIAHAMPSIGKKLNKKKRRKNKRRK